MPSASSPGGNFGMEHLATTRTILYYSNLLFAAVFYLLLLATRKRHTRECRHGWIDIAIASFCGLVAVEYLGADAYGIVFKGKGFERVDLLLVWLVRGVVWISLSISVLVRGSNWISVIKASWWMVFFMLISVLNVVCLVELHHVEILEVAPWIATSVLVINGIRNMRGLLSPQAMLDDSFSESLLNEETNEKRSDDELGKASLLSKLSFSWVNPMLRLGKSRPLVLDDIPSLGSEDEAFVANEKFNEAWINAIKKDKGACSSSNLVFWAITRVYWKNMLVLVIYILLRTVSVVITPLLLYAFVNYSKIEKKNIKQGVYLVGCLVLLKVVESLSYRHFYFYGRRIGMRMRSGLMVAVYQKQLKLSCVGRRKHSAGEIVNYIAVDAYRMGDFPVWFHVGWASVFQIFLAIIVLYAVVGLGVLPGLLPFIICGFLNVPIARLFQKFQTEFMVVQDSRLRSTSEILNNMKVIKLQSWEKNFKAMIESLRNDEFKWLSKTQYLKATSTILYWLSPTIVASVIFFGCLIFSSTTLDAGTVFTVLAALRSMSEPVRVLPDALTALIQVKVSFDRINAFMLEDELGHEDVLLPAPRDSNNIVLIQQGCFSWDTEMATPTLKDIELEVTLGQKIAVCGPVGAGKSSLLSAILGEIPKLSGTVIVNGSVAYVSQASWIQSGTVRDNILFGKVMDKARYDEAIRVCALEKDIESFNHGDLTEIGQRGLNLSGGQKQRIQLARAVYNDADLYLLDDPFSAVDAHTAATLFNDCVMTALGKKTVILVTHQVEFLNNVDKILVVEEGRITQSGSHKELLIAGTTFEQLVFAHKNTIGSIGTLHQTTYSNQMDEKNNTFTKEEDEITTEAGTQLTEEEEKEVGDVGWKTFSDYVSISKGLFNVFCILMLQSGFVALQGGASFWLAMAIQSRITGMVVVGIYTLIASLSTLFAFLRTLLSVVLGLKASRAFFSAFTNSIFNAPMLFFDSTPNGRILTRASSDLSVLDLDIPVALGFVVAGSMEIIAGIGIMASVTWQVLFVGIFAIICSKYVHGYYQKSAGELMRINGTTKAPVMSYASETALGVATIRAFNMVDRFYTNYFNLVDTDAKVFLASTVTLEWLILRTEAFQNLTLFAASIFLIFAPKGYIDPGLVGLSLSYAFSITSTQVFLTRWYSSSANYLVSVERIKQYMHIPQQPAEVIPDKRPPSLWPQKGRIQLMDLKIRYRPNAPMVLKGITCTFQEGTRVGVVGRTGSGKTTLINALFRLVEPCGGRIVVDGVDICSIGLKDLRLKLSIIPQEPTLFRGSVRTNLDPLGIHSDDEIWKALEKCQLKATISELPNLLDSSVSDEGENWSMGQRQLFGLGRVLLRRNKILVLDEATASIDSATDAILQRVIREEFAECTVMTVAHRVPTVIDSDMVMVLSYGKLVEYDEPAKLMGTNSTFSKLVAEYWASCITNHG